MTLTTTTTATNATTTATTAEQRVADAFRLTAMKLEDAIERGKHSGKIAAEDLLQTLLSIADDLDPPVPLHRSSDDLGDSEDSE